MTDSNATYTRTINCNHPDFQTGTITFELLSYFAAAGNEAFPKKDYSLTLVDGLGTIALPTPDNTGVGSWLWRVTLPDGEPYKVTLAYSASSIQLTAWLSAAQSTATPNSLTDTFVLKAGDTVTGQLNFSGTDHAGIKLISLTTVERDALTPAEGMVIYNETDSVVQVYQGAAWVDYGSGGGAVSSVFSRTGAVVAATSDYHANQVDVTPAGGISSEKVQAALEELDGDIQSVAGSIPFSFTALNDTPSSISQNTLMWGSPIGATLLEKTAAESLTLLGAAASGHNHDSSYADLRPVENEQTGTSYTLALTDEDKIVQTTNGATVTVTVPPNSTVAFTVGAIVGLEQYGAGTLTVAAGAGVTIRSLGGLLSLSGQYASAALRKIGTDEWLLVGALA